MLCALTLALCWEACAIASVDGPLAGYGFSSLDYFAPSLIVQRPQDEFLSDSLWDEVHPLPDGGAEIYRPPGPVLDLLQAPTPEAGRRYLRWNEIRMKKIDQAQQVLKELSLQEIKQKEVL